MENRIAVNGRIGNKKMKCRRDLNVMPNVENHVICFLTRTRRQGTNYRGTRSDRFKQREKLLFW